MYRFQRWREAMQLAPDAKTVRALMRDYVQSLGPVATLLPAECRQALEGEPDVQAIAVVLLKEELCFQGAEEDRALLHEMAHTFASASVRITLLHAKPLMHECSHS